MAVASSSTSAPTSITGHDKQPSTVTLLLSPSNHVPSAVNAPILRPTLNLPPSTKASESKVIVKSAVKGAALGQHQPNIPEREGEAEQKPVPEKSNSPAADSRILNWSHGVSLDLSMNLCSVPQTPMSPSIYTFPQPCSPRNPTPTQRLSAAVQAWNHGRLSPPSHESLQIREDRQSLAQAPAASMQSLPPLQPDATPDDAHKSAGEREKERERDRQMDKRYLFFSVVSKEINCKGAKWYVNQACRLCLGQSLGFCDQVC